MVRLDCNADYAGPGGSAELLGLYFADAGQHLEHRLFVDHNAPRTRSNVVYKGALQGQGAHTVWVGNVLIRKVAEGIETYEQNRNLVLTDGCQADSVPNLEIETGEIEGAGHASTTGRFDDQQLFYLQSRGIPEDEARRLVVHGFFNDIIRKIGVPEIEDEPDGRRRGRAGEERDPGRGRRGMSFIRACAPDRPRGRQAARGDRRRRRRGARARRRGVLRHPRRVLATPTSRCPRATSRAASSSAGCTGRPSTCAPASPPPCRPSSRSRSTPSGSTATTCSSTSRTP